MTRIGWTYERGQWRAICRGATLEECGTELLRVAGDRPSRMRLMTTGQRPEEVFAGRKTITPAERVGVETAQEPS